MKSINWDTAVLCAKVSALAYEEPARMERWLRANKIEHKKLKFFEKDGAQAYGMHLNNGFVLIAFRGTELNSWNDIRADIMAWSTSSETVGRVHTGFKGELDKLQSSILEWLGSLTDKRLLITGHSLGAAMASIFAARMSARNVDVELYTYGSPRVGNKEWAAQFDNIRAYRFVNNNDVVTRVPFDILYEHVGEIHYMAYDYSILVGRMTRWHRLRDQFLSRFRALKKLEVFDSFYDHLGMRYIDKLINRK